MKRFGIAIATAAASATFVLGGCSSVTNQGGDTTCGKFKDQDNEKQSSEVAAMLKKRKGQQPSNGEITATRLAVETYCKTVGNDDNKIKDIDPTS